MFDNAVVKRHISAHKTRNGEIESSTNICALIKVDNFPNQWNMKSQNEDMYRTHHAGEKGDKKDPNRNIKDIKSKNTHTRRRLVAWKTNSWHNRFQKLLTRYEKRVENYSGLEQLFILHYYLYKDNYWIEP